MPNYPMARCDVDQHVFLPYLKAVADEAKSLAGSVEERRDAVERQFIADEVELGSAEAHARAAQRRSQIQAGRQ